MLDRLERWLYNFTTECRDVGKFVVFKIIEHRELILPTFKVMSWIGLIGFFHVLFNTATETKEQMHRLEVLLDSLISGNLDYIELTEFLDIHQNLVCVTVEYLYEITWFLATLPLDSPLGEILSAFLREPVICL